MGSLRNPAVPAVAQQLRRQGFDVFDAWWSAGPEADDCWQRHEQLLGHNYIEALGGAHAENVFRFDLRHLTAASAAVLLAPAGKSAHLELGWMLGQGKPGYVLLNGEPDRYDVMLKFATGVFTCIDALIEELR
jgi:hypothetical protein